VGSGARAALALTALVAVVAVGCGDVPRPHSGAGKYPQYARYQDEAGARRQLEALLRTIPIYPAGRPIMGDLAGTDYFVGKDYETIEAEPYRLDGYVRVAGQLTGPRIMRFLRRVLPARGWRCEFTPRAHNVRRSYSCRRGQQWVGGGINDSGGYGLGLVASDVVPPIKQVPQVE
jgi:hypothetical protein